MEKMAEQIRKAKSYKYSVTIHAITDSQETGEPSVVSTGTEYWLAPDSTRFERTSPGKWNGPGPQYTTIHPAGKPGIFISHRNKQFSREPVLQHNGSYNSLEGLGKFSGAANRDLGAKQIDGKKALGFEIDIKKMDPDSHGVAEIWIDTESDLPVLVRLRVKRLGFTTIHTITDIRWNVDLAFDLLDASPPEGYTDITRNPPTLDEQLRQIGEALRIYAQSDWRLLSPGSH